jgi:hypothetical protein
MKLYASFSLVLLLTGSISVQAPPDTLWSKIFGGDSQGGCNNTGDVGRVVEGTDDGGFIISGWTNSYGMENTDVWLISTDAQGNETWSSAVTVNDTADEAIYDMNKTDDGGFILTGITEIIYCSGGHGARFACGGKVLLVRTNELGDTLWTRSYEGGNVGWSEGNSVEETVDGGYVIVGRADTEENGTDLWISVTDKKGNPRWSRIFGKNGYDEGHSVQQTDDGGFIITGITQSPQDDSQRVWLLRTNELGDTLWTCKYLVGDWSEGKCVLPTDDGGFIIAGTVESWNDNAGARLVVPPALEEYLKIRSVEKNIVLRKDMFKMHNESEILNQYPEINTQQVISSETYRDIEHYRSVISQEKIIEGKDAWLIRTNELGDILWTQIIGGPGWDDIHSLSPTSDGGYVLAGEKYMEKTDSQDIWLIRVNEMGDTLWTTTLGDSSNEVAYDIKQTQDNGYIVTAMKHNRELDVDQTWLLRYGEEASGIENPIERNPTQFVLDQNFPNPFNSRTIINYKLRMTNKVNLSIYNLLGQQIITLVSEIQNAGSHQVEWNGIDQAGQTVSSGIYLYKLETENDVQMRKMMMIK